MNRRVRTLTLGILAASVAVANAHGPQIQITNENNKIVTRELHFEEPYSSSLTPPKSLYVMAAQPFDGVWYSRPNGEIDAILGLPKYPSGPGLAYGYDLADGAGPQAFEAGSVLSVAFTAGLKRWDGVAFVDAGVTELKAFRGSNPNIAAPDANFAVTSDGGPFDSLSLASIAVNYGGAQPVDGANAHGSLRWALLGDGNSPASSSPDGVYLVSLQLSSSHGGLIPSDEYFFVLNKNSPWSTVADAVGALGVEPSLQQWAAPEPNSSLLVWIALTAVASVGRWTRS
jgi:hypothetical protein